MKFYLTQKQRGAFGVLLYMIFTLIFTCNSTHIEFYLCYHISFITRNETHISISREERLLRQNPPVAA